MSLQIERIPTFSDNYTYLVICEETREAAIIDAPEADPVIRRVDEVGATVTKILSTHHHPDHAMANPELAKRYDVPVYGHHSDSGRLAGFTHGVDEGDTVEIGRQTARVLFIPSHTMGHIAYVFDEAKALFSGDMLFAGGCGRLFEGSAEMMYNALCEKLAALPDDMRVFCGHEYTEGNLRFAAHVEPDNQAIAQRLAAVGEIRKNAAADWHDATPAEMTIPSTIGEEKATNPFMRSKDAEELGRLRTLKDSF
ncbi:MAG: hydroxyacylglutathione hydrolase [Deltaproteobacteria bacterium]|nr:hydroxyacylglutathione hydrolase [Deltaproteobacteria bacterium]MBW2386920.1 hydroxyacylglutathione hydrolase [Deltaproteobacteria bacterium]